MTLVTALMAMMENTVKYQVIIVTQKLHIFPVICIQCMKTVKIIFALMMHLVTYMLAITFAIALMVLVDLFVALEMKVNSKK